MRGRNITAVARHHELGAFKEHVAAAADKVHRAVNFAAFPVSAAFLGVVRVLTAQESHVLVDVLVAFVLLQRHLAASALPTSSTLVLQCNVLQVHLVILREIQRCRMADRFGIGLIRDNCLFKTLADNGEVRGAHGRFAMTVGSEFRQVIFAIRHENHEALGRRRTRSTRRCESSLEIAIDTDDKIDLTLFNSGGRNCET